MLKCTGRHTMFLNCDWFFVCLFVWFGLVCFQGSKHKSLEEKMVDFCPISDNCCPDVSLQYGFSCPLQGVQNKLNEAARKIPILSQEKQQLTEMGNRHRADIGMVLKEGKCILEKMLAYTFRIKAVNLLIL